LRVHFALKGIQYMYCTLKGVLTYNLVLGVQK
jgi:hypothetical protein